jgi:xylulokinase
MGLLGLDIGTSACKAAVYSTSGARLAFASRSYPTEGGESGEAAVDSRKIDQAIRAVIAETAAAARAAGDPVAAISVGSMGEAFVPVGADGSILAESILSVDRRGGGYLSLFSSYSPEALYRITPNIPGACYSFPKLRWIKDHQIELYRSAWKFLFWADYAVYLLTGAAIACHSLANRTLLFDFLGERWSEELLAASGIDGDKLGEIVPAGVVVGTVRPGVARELGLESGVRVVSGGHDQCPAALGAGAIAGGKAACGMGTVACFTPVMDGIPDLDALRRLSLNIEHHVVPGKYVSFIYNQAGSLQKWFARTFAAAEGGAEAGPDLFERLGAEMPEGPSGLLVLPFFEPTGAPLFMSDHSGCVLGLTTATTRGQILKGIVEGTAYYFADSLSAMESVGCRTDRFVASGGGARSDRWLQTYADVFGRPFVRAAHTEAGTLGAAILAGVAVGEFSSFSEAVAAYAGEERTFEPVRERTERYAAMLECYRRIYPALRAGLPAAGAS